MAPLSNNALKKRIKIAFANGKMLLLIILIVTNEATFTRPMSLV